VRALGACARYISRDCVSVCVRACVRVHVCMPLQHAMAHALPFARYISHDRSLKHFPHACVFPRREFNTHIMDTDAESGARSSAQDGEAVGEADDERARFIFHPAGRRNKLDCLRQMVSCRAAAGNGVTRAVVAACGS
jgi:hypothetical protein